METELLLVYLNDHLAGSVGAIALLEDLTAQTSFPQLKVPMDRLKNEIAADQTTLKDLIAAHGGTNDLAKSVGAWICEKAVRLKLRWSDQDTGHLAMFEALEMLALGIEGKRLMWRFLKTLDDIDPAIDGEEMERLELTASEQRDRVELLRLEIGRTAFFVPTVSSGNLDSPEPS